MSKPLRIVGLMSGTSMDGIDAALIETDGRDRVRSGPALTLPYDSAMRGRLKQILGGRGPVAEVERDLTELHATAVRRLIERHEIDAVDLVGFPGHTILHRPQAGSTWQIGDGDLLAQRLGIDVVCDFRSADVAAGGEGAPLVPVYHRALAAGLERPLAVLNIGGVANVTWVGEGEGDLLAFDTGPGNALIDDWVQAHTGEPADMGGVHGAQGQVDEAQVARLLAHSYFGRQPPKSLDRDDFAGWRPTGASLADGAATVTAMTAASVTAATVHFPAPARRWLVTGGGRHNPTLMAMLAARLGVPVAPVEAVGWDGDALEAQAFAYLACRVVEKLPLTFPGTTGVAAPVLGGRLCRRA